MYIVEGVHMAADLVRLVDEVRTIGQAFRELFGLMEEKREAGVLVDCLGVVLCDRIEELGGQLEDAVMASSQPPQ